MSEKKPLPLIMNVKPKPKSCPVCGHSSYSQGGIHPQCVGVQADKKMRARRAEEAESALAAEVGHDERPAHG